MGVFSNLWAAVRGHAHNAAEAIQDSQILTILDQQIRDVNVAIGDAREQLAKMVANRKVKDKAIAEIDAEIESFLGHARNAKAKGDDGLAREAAQHIIKLKQQREGDAKLRDQFATHEAKMQANIKQMQNKIDSLKRQVEAAKANEAMIAAQRAVSTSAVAGDGKLSGAVASLERLEKRQIEQQALLEAADELDGDGPQDLKARLERLDGPGNNEVDDLLAKL